MSAIGRYPAFETSAAIGGRIITNGAGFVCAFPFFRGRRCVFVFGIFVGELEDGFHLTP